MSNTIRPGKYRTWLATDKEYRGYIAALGNLHKDGVLTEDAEAGYIRFDVGEEKITSAIRHPQGIWIALVPRDDHEGKVPLDRSKT